DFFIGELGLIVHKAGEYWHFGRPGQVAIDLLQRQQIVSSGLNVVYIDEDDAALQFDFKDVDQEIRELLSPTQPELPGLQNEQQGSTI
ncbi:hypothetical protein LCGC14_2330380, partial [marine sediment metagenome]